MEVEEGGPSEQAETQHSEEPSTNDDAAMTFDSSLPSDAVDQCLEAEVDKDTGSGRVEPVAGHENELDVNGDEDDCDDEEAVEVEGEGLPDTVDSSQSTEYSDTDVEGYQLDYSCLLCGHDFLTVNNLFAHLETHDSEDYALAVQKSVAADQNGFGDSTVSESRKWPSRFRRLHSPILNTLTQFCETDVENGHGSSGEDSESESSPPPPKLVPMEIEKPFSSSLDLPEILPRRKYTCPHCPKEFRRSDHFRQHLINHEGSNTFECDICGQKFSVLITLRRHMASHEELMALKCSRCPRRFQNAASLQKHEVNCISSETEESVNHMKCGSCTQSFESESSRIEHENRVHGISQSKVVLRCRYTACRALFSTLKLLIEHYKQKHGAERLLEAAAALQNHSRPSLPSDANPETTNGIQETEATPTMTKARRQGVMSPGTEGSIECRLCFQFLSSLPERNAHENGVHDINNPSTILQCKYSKCKKILGAKNWLARHIREHRERLNKGLEMESEEDLVEMSRALATPPPSENALERRLHPTDSFESDREGFEDSWDCRLCEEGFLEETSRAYHEEQFHDTGNVDSDYCCKVCGKAVGNFSSLLIHLGKTHKNSERRRGTISDSESQRFRKPPPAKAPENSGINLIFPCRHCDLTFTDQHVRVTHENEIHDTKDALDNYFPCKVCEKVMTLRGLRKHLRRIHGLNSFFEAEDVVKEAEMPRKLELPQKIPEKLPPPPSHAPNKRTSEAPTALWTCRLCFENFDEQRQRETHEHSIHGTNSPNATYVCKYDNCELTFGTFRALIKHLREHGETAFPKGQQKLPIPTLTQYKQHI